MTFPRRGNVIPDAENTNFDIGNFLSMSPNTAPFVGSHLILYHSSDENSKFVAMPHGIFLKNRAVLGDIVEF